MKRKEPTAKPTAETKLILRLRPVDVVNIRAGLNVATTQVSGMKDAAALVDLDRNIESQVRRQLDSDGQEGKH